MSILSMDKSVPKGNNLENSAFHIVEADHCLEIVDRRSTTFRSEHKFLLAAQAPSRFFVREYFWSGSGSEREPLPELVTDVDEWGFPRQRIHGPLLIEGNTRIIVVDLGRTILAGEQVFVHFKHRMKDLSGTFKSVFVARPSRNVQKRIGLRLVLPDWAGLKVFYKSFVSEEGNATEYCSVCPVESGEGRMIFEKEISHVSGQNMVYKLEWVRDEKDDKAIKVGMLK